METVENHPPQTETTTDNQPSQSMSRRRLLMLLGAGGAATALATVPDRWSKPVVEAGDLSVAADGSRVDNRISISGLEIGAFDKSKPSPEYSGEFHYEDPGSGVTDSATLYAYLTPCSQIIFDNQAISSISGGHVYGGPANGTVTFGFTGECPNAATTFNVQLSAGGRSSNTLSGSIDT